MCSENHVIRGHHVPNRSHGKRTNLSVEIHSLEQSIIAIFNLIHLLHGQGAFVEEDEDEDDDEDGGWVVAFSSRKGRRGRGERDRGRFARDVMIS